MDEMEGSYKDEFHNLEAYCNELRTSNPGSDISVEVSKEALENGRREFRRMYVCFNACKVGWKAGCRLFIGLDGTFLKGKAKGILLNATGIDANDCLYPIAFGLTQQENKCNWRWFLQWLRRSLDLEDGEKFTLMSDMQKGLHLAILEILPKFEHRLCARHIYANWSKRWRGHELQKKFFSCAWSTYEEQYVDNLKDMEALSKEAAQSFLPVIRMFEGIREKMMQKWADSEKVASLWKNEFSPKCVDLYETNRKLAAGCKVVFNGDDGYEITEGSEIMHLQSMGVDQGSLSTCDLRNLS
ncbi:uncharacterized protein LOC114727523 [Neltuma alba]|uniref:uncharacterized protein LOC114727523 n=1 Tax=Neltuma alba TaxID=207710 RepID=UPI0010A42EF1|nr:uncharacterized protein LOC114727523 [Prosopis alba]